MTFPPLDQLLPHRQPMILLNRMVAADATTGVCEVDIGPDTMFGDHEGVPAYVGLEYMAQVVAAYSGYQLHCQSLPIVVGFLLGAPKFTSHCRFFLPGQTLRVEAAHVWGESQLARFECAITDAQTGALLQQAELSVFKPENLAAFGKEPPV